jgi:hypothetical protein
MTLNKTLLTEPEAFRFQGIFCRTRQIFADILPYVKKIQRSSGGKIAEK